MNRVRPFWRQQIFNQEITYSTQSTQQHGHKSPQKLCIIQDWIIWNQQTKSQSDDDDSDSDKELQMSLFRPWHWLCVRWPACLFEAVGPVRATTYAAIILLGIGKTRKATLIRTYFSLYIGLMYKSLQLHAWNQKFPPRKHLGGQWVFWGASGFSDSLAPRASGCHSPMSRPALYVKLDKFYIVSVDSRFSS